MLIIIISLIIVVLFFNYSGFPPPHSIIRALAIHKAPEVVGEVVQCCPKHIDEQNKKCMYNHHSKI